MRTQKVFQAGNSNVVAIPKDLCREIGFSPGERVVVARIPQQESVVIKKASSADKEFRAWLQSVLQGDAAILDELAVR